MSASLQFRTFENIAIHIHFIVCRLLYPDDSVPYFVSKLARQQTGKMIFIMILLDVQFLSLAVKYFNFPVVQPIPCHLNILRQRMEKSHIVNRLLFSVRMEETDTRFLIILCMGEIDFF